MKEATIGEIALWQCGIGMDFTYSSGHHTYAECLIFEIRCDGFTGLGESPGNWDLAVESARKLLGRDPRQLEALLSFLTCADSEQKLVREGLSIALYDLVGKMCGMPVYALLGGQRRNDFPGMPVVHVGTPEVMARRAKKWVNAGYRFLKLKLRGNSQEDLEAVRAVRKAIGDEIDLQVDANIGYRGAEEALSVIQRMEDVRISIVEDIVDSDLDTYSRIRARIAPRLMVDGEAWWPNVHNVIARGAADVINHHPNNQGGLATALQIDAVATAAGLVTAIGSCGYFGIQNSAFQMLATVIGLERPCEDIGLLEYHSGPTASEYLWGGAPTVVKETYPIRDGKIHVPDVPGLGLELDPERLAAYVKKQTVVRANEV